MPSRPLVIAASQGQHLFRIESTRGYYRLQIPNSKSQTPAKNKQSNSQKGARFPGFGLRKLGFSRGGATPGGAGGVPVRDGRDEALLLNPARRRRSLGKWRVPHLPSCERSPYRRERIRE